MRALSSFLIACSRIKLWNEKLLSESERNFYKFSSKISVQSLLPFRMEDCIILLSLWKPIMRNRTSSILESFFIKNKQVLKIYSFKSRIVTQKDLNIGMWNIKFVKKERGGKQNWKKAPHIHPQPAPLTVQSSRDLDS